MSLEMFDFRYLFIKNNPGETGGRVGISALRRRGPSGRGIAFL